MEPSRPTAMTGFQLELQDWSFRRSLRGSVSYDEASLYPMSPISPQDVPVTPSQGSSSNSSNSSFIELPDTPAMLDSPPFLAYTPSSSPPYMGYAPSSCNSPQYSFTGGSSPDVKFYHPSGSPFSMAYKSESFESPSGASHVPLFQPRPMHPSPLPANFWSPPLRRSVSFESSSPLSFSSSSQGSTASSSSLASSSSGSYYPGDYMSDTSTPASFQNFRSTASPSSSSAPHSPEVSSNDQAEDQHAALSAAFAAAASHVASTAPSAGVNYLYTEGPRDKQPPYATIIYQALMSHPQKRMVLAEIYNFFREKHPERAARDGGWKNSIRHNLSMNGAFVKEPRPSDDNTKRYIWVLSDEAQRHGIKSTTRYRRNAPRAPISKRVQPSRKRPTRSSLHDRNRSIALSYVSPPPSFQLPLPAPRYEYFEQAPPLTPPESPVFADDVNMPRMAFSNVHIKTEFNMDYDSPAVELQPAVSAQMMASAFDDTRFEEDGVSVFDPETGTWQKVSYASDGHFREQYSLTRPVRLDENSQLYQD